MTLALRKGTLGPDHPSTLGAMLRYFELSKDPTGCRDTVEMWEKLNRTDVESLYTAARMRAVTSAVLRAQNDVEALRPAEGEADRAVAWLHKAVAAGFKDVERMKKDKDLDALRDREDFKKLLAELEDRVCQDSNPDSSARCQDWNPEQQAASGPRGLDPPYSDVTIRRPPGHV